MRSILINNGERLFCGKNIEQLDNTSLTFVEKNTIKRAEYSSPIKSLILSFPWEVYDINIPAVLNSEAQSIEPNNKECFTTLGESFLFSIGSGTHNIKNYHQRVLTNNKDIYSTDSYEEWNKDTKVLRIYRDGKQVDFCYRCITPIESSKDNKFYLTSNLGLDLGAAASAGYGTGKEGIITFSSKDEKINHYGFHSAAALCNTLVSDAQYGKYHWVYSREKSSLNDSSVFQQLDSSYPIYAFYLPKNNNRLYNFIILMKRDTLSTTDQGDSYYCFSFSQNSIQDKNYYFQSGLPLQKINSMTGAVQESRIYFDLYYTDQPFTFFDKDCSQWLIIHGSESGGAIIKAFGYNYLTY